jgi:hypothetical protein
MIDETTWQLNSMVSETPARSAFALELFIAPASRSEACRMGIVDEGTDDPAWMVCQRVLSKAGQSMKAKRR